MRTDFWLSAEDGNADRHADHARRVERPGAVLLRADKLRDVATSPRHDRTGERVARPSRNRARLEYRRQGKKVRKAG